MIPLSLKEFAIAVGAEPKWILSAIPRLGGPIEYSASNASWLRLARTLNRELGIPLWRAAELAGAPPQAIARRQKGPGRPRRQHAGDGGANAGRPDGGPSGGPPSGGPAGGAQKGDRKGDRKSAHDGGQNDAHSGGRGHVDEHGKPRPANRATASPVRPAARRTVCLVAIPSEGVRLTVNLDRHRSASAAALAAAISLGVPKRPGRKRPSPPHFGAALGRARRLGINFGLLRFRLRRRPDHHLTGFAPPGSGGLDVAAILTRFQAGGVRTVVTGDVAERLRGGGPIPGPSGEDPQSLDLCLAPTRANLRRLSNVLRQLGARVRAPDSSDSTLRGASVPDPVTLRCTPVLALSTRFGSVNLRAQLAGVGDFNAVVRGSTPVRAFGIEVPVLELPALARVRQVSGTRSDADRLLLLETVLAVPAWEARRATIAKRRLL